MVRTHVKIPSVRGVARMLATIYRLIVFVGPPKVLISLVRLVEGRAAKQGHGVLAAHDGLFVSRA